jgi:hypothetical protein
MKEYIIRYSGPAAQLYPHSAEFNSQGPIPREEKARGPSGLDSNQVT